MALGLVSCTKPTKADEPIAKVGEIVLTTSQLITAIPQNASSEDSAIIADEFVRRWVTQQVVMQKAQLNLSEEELDIEEAIEEYRRALLVERYQQKVVDQKFKPSITDEEIAAYYNNAIDNFRLNETIMKGVFAVIPNDAPNIKSFRKSLSLDEDEKYAKVENYIYNFAKTSQLSLDKWTTFAAMKQFIPIELQPTEQQLMKQKQIEVSDKENTYFIIATDMKLADDYAPIDYVSDKVYSILLNKKKIDFIKELSANLYNEAMHNNSITYYK